jgi:hypothetical protein
LIEAVEGRRILARPRCRWEDTISVDLREICWEGVDWILLAEDRGQWRASVCMVINLRIPQMAGNFTVYLLLKTDSSMELVGLLLI